MKDLLSRIKDLQLVAFYNAPDNAQIAPVQIQKNTELLELITGGEVFFEVDGKDRKFEKGALFWHKEGQYTIHRTTPQNPYRCAVFIFSVSDNNRPVPRISFWNNDADINRFASECLHLFHSKELDENVLCLYIYSTLLRHAMATSKPNQQSYHASLDKALDYIHQNLSKKIAITELAKESKISQPQLFRLFQSHLNITPHQYILSQQLTKARTMLASTQTPIKKIASECGFESLEVFYRRFGTESGMPPGEYRRKFLSYRTFN